MKKYGFTNKFKILKNKMNAKNIQNRSFNKKRIFENNFNILKKELKKGKEVNAEELLLIEDTFLLNGIPVLIYIKDHTNTKINITGKRKKVHFMNCITIKDMKLKNRFERYVSTTRTDEKYLISIGKKEKELKLNICKNCIKEIKEKRNIDIKTAKDFFDSDIIEKDFNEKDITYNENDKTYYPPNWKKISYNLRELNNWNCQKCYNNFFKDKSNLHVHHKDGVKQNVSPKNLEVLCHSCHSKEPFHSHMKNK